MRSLRLLLEMSLKGMFSGGVDAVMNRLYRRRVLLRCSVSVGIAVAALLIVVLTSFLIPAGKSVPAVIMRVSAGDGIRIKNRGEWQSLVEGRGVVGGTVLRNDSKVPATLTTERGSSITLRRGTSIKVDMESDRYRISLFEGDLFVATRGEVFSIRCDGIEVVNRGTKFTVHRGLFYLLVVVVEGEVECFNAFGKVVVRSGEQTRISLKGAPEKPVRIKDEEIKKAWYKPLLRPSDAEYSDTDMPKIPLDMPIKKPKQK